MDELKKILKAAFYRGNEVADVPTDDWDELADDWEKWYNKYVVNDFSKHIVIPSFFTCCKNIANATEMCKEQCEDCKMVYVG